MGPTNSQTTLCLTCHSVGYCIQDQLEVVVFYDSLINHRCLGPYLNFYRILEGKAKIIIFEIALLVEVIMGNNYMKSTDSNMHDPR